MCSNNKCIRNWREKQGHFLIYFTLDFIHTDLFQRGVFCVLQAFTNVTLLAHRGDYFKGVDKPWTVIATY